MIETCFKNSQNQNFKLFQKRRVGVRLLGYVCLLGIIRYVFSWNDKLFVVVIKDIISLQAIWWNCWYLYQICGILNITTL